MIWICHSSARLLCILYIYFDARDSRPAQLWYWLDGGQQLQVPKPSRIIIVFTPAVVCIHQTCVMPSHKMGKLQNTSPDFVNFFFDAYSFLTKAVIFNLPVNNIYIYTHELGKNTEEAAVATRLLTCIWNADGSNIYRVAISRAWTSFVIFVSLPRQISR